VKMIRVALILPHLGWGGVQTLLLVQTRDAAAFGVAYSVFSLAPPAKAPYADELARLGVEVVHEPGRRVLDVQRAQRLARRLNGGRFDVAHGHLWAGNLVAPGLRLWRAFPFWAACIFPVPGAARGRSFVAGQRLLRFATARSPPQPARRPWPTPTVGVSADSPLSR